MSRVVLLLLSVMGLGLAGCASAGLRPTTAEREVLARAPSEERQLAIPLIVQAENECGPATLTMALRRFDGAIRLEDVVSMTMTPAAKGSFQTDLTSAGRRLGFAAYRVPDLAGVVGAVDHGIPVVVFQNLGFRAWPVWHYALVTGYDRRRGELRLHTGDASAEAWALDRFIKTWERADRWAIMMVPPHFIPEHASLDEALANAEVFAREGRRDQALAVYRAVSDRYPRAFEGPAGAGLMWASEGDYSRAEAAFQEASSRAPDHPGLRHNLQELRRQMKLRRVPPAS